MFGNFNQARNREGAGRAKPTYKIFRPPWKNVFKIIGYSLKHLDPSQKTLRPPGVLSWLRACL